MKQLQTAIDPKMAFLTLHRKYSTPRIFFIDDYTKELIFHSLQFFIWYTTQHKVYKSLASTMHEKARYFKSNKTDYILISFKLSINSADIQQKKSMFITDYNLKWIFS